MPTQNKIAFITGANRGIGLETARGLGKLGITVLLGSRDKSKGDAAVAALKKDGIASAEAIQFDVANLPDHDRLKKILNDRFGRLDILVNNAGVNLEKVEFGAAGGFNTTSSVPQETLREVFN